jgi:hypothetical protein
MVFVTSLHLSAEESSSKDRETERQEQRKAARAEMLEKRKEQAKQRGEYRKLVMGNTAMEFEKKNSDSDLLRGRITYSMPDKDDASGYVAYIYVSWGDLDNKIPDISPDYYSNWDGYVKVQQAGKASVVKEFAFDDHNHRDGGVGRRDGIGRDSSRRTGDRSEPGQGVGTDMIIKDTESSMVAWKSGIVGATDGLLIKLELKKPEARGTIKAGNFTISYEIVSKPETPLSVDQTE